MILNKNKIYTKYCLYWMTLFTLIFTTKLTLIFMITRTLDLMFLDIIGIRVEPLVNV